MRKSKEKKESSKAVKKSAPQSGRIKSLLSNFGIKKQLILGFIIPVLFVILIGAVSYKKSERGMVANYEEAMTSSINMGVEYLEYGFGLISNDLLQLSIDSNLVKYCAGAYRGRPMEETTFTSGMQSELMMKVSSNQLLQSVAIVPGEKEKMISTDNVKGPGVFDQWKAEEEGISVLSQNQNLHVAGKHPVLDGLLGTNTDSYAISFIGISENRSACIAADVSSDSIRQILGRINLGKEGIAAFITPDNRELTVGNDTSPIRFTEQPFYQDSVSGDSPSGFEYVSYQGRPYLYIYGKCEGSGSMVCALVPKSQVTYEADQIKRLTLILMVVACLIVAAIGGFICFHIGSGMKRISTGLAKASGGDLTIKLAAKGSDEFSVLSNNVMEMLSNTRRLIENAEQTMDSVSDLSARVEHVSDSISVSAADISNATGEIETGANQQADSLQKCLRQMDRLSGKIGAINDQVNEIEDSIHSTREKITNGMATTDELSSQSAVTTDITETVAASVTELENKTVLIEQFIDIINDISRQTNLLSLNASIEAARAGTAGRGFTVVAEEIRSLADGSNQAAREIQKVIEEIKGKTKETVELALSAKDTVNRQAETVRETLAVFEEINKTIERLLVNSGKIGKSTEDANAERISTLEALENISAVSEENAAAATAVSGITREQTKTIQALRQAAKELTENMAQLKTAFSIFKIH